MIKVLSDQSVHERRIAIRVDWNDIKVMLSQKALRETGLHPDATEIEVVIEQESEGSPAYSVRRWSAKVLMVEKASDLPVPSAQ